VEKVIGYVRVSLDCPVDEVLSLEEQREAIEGWARTAGVHVVSVLVDEGAAATSELDGRLALGDALELVHEGKAKGLAVARLERLAGDLVLQELLRADLALVGASVRSAIPAEDSELTATPLDAERRRIREIVEAIPGYRLAMRDLRVRARRALYGDRDRSMLSRIESLNEQGSSFRDLSHGLSEAARKPRLGETFDLEAFRRFVARRRRRMRDEG